jgi:2-amino-4-hydroxy-6-hydroxymethyldihydropteridine diphosphokinase
MGPFLNLVAQFEHDLEPDEILAACLSVESEGGRCREESTWLPRTIDIDILALHDRTLTTERLTVPHPRIAERRFVLLPFADLNPRFWIPAPFSATVEELLAKCPDHLPITLRYPASAVFPDGGRST